jgi:hypothetical protein
VTDRPDPVDDGTEGSEADTNPLRRTIDVCVFAPVGVAVAVAEDLPELIAKGRRKVELQLANARVVGRFVVTKSQRRVTDRLEELLHNGGDGGAAVDEPEDDADTSPVRPPPDPVAEAVVADALADYDTLSASQVVRRLESLGPDQLRAVQRYEASTRNRRTILNRAGQLLDEAQSGPSYD